MSQPWIVEGNFFGKPVRLEAEADRYKDNGRLAVLLYSEDEYEDDGRSLFTVVTVNVPGIAIEDPETQIILNHDVTRETLNMVIESGFLVPEPVNEVARGQATFKVFQLTPSAAAWCAENNISQ